MSDDTFSRFWILYPRKVAKKDAEKAWRAMTDFQKFAAIEALPIHVRYWAAAGTTAEFLPYPATWCRGERWTDELAMPQAKNVAEAWWSSDEGIHRKALELGMTPRPGESWPNLKARIAAELEKRKAA